MMRRLATIITGRRAAPVIVLLGLLLGGLGIGLLGEAEREATPVDTLPAGLDSTEGTALRDELPTASGRTAVVLWTADEGSLDQADLTDLGGLAEQLGAVGGEGGPVSPSEDGTAAVAVVPVDSSDPEDLADLVGELRDDLDAGSPDGVTAQVTGPAGVQADLGRRPPILPQVVEERLPVGRVGRVSLPRPAEVAYAAPGHPRRALEKPRRLHRADEQHRVALSALEMLSHRQSREQVTSRSTARHDHPHPHPVIRDSAATMPICSSAPVSAEPP